MRIPQFAIENRQFTTMIILLLVVMGVVSFLTMPRSEDPLVNPAGSNIVVIYPGAVPADIEELVIDPIETVLNEIEDIKYLHSRCQDGLGFISIEFKAGSDPDKKYSDVVQKVNSIGNLLPGGILDLEIIKWAISDVNILQIAITSDAAAYRDMEEEADRLKRMLEATPDVRRVDIWAIPRQQVQVALDLEKIAALKIPMSQVFAAIQSANQNIPGGFLDIGGRRFNIQTSGSYQSMDEIAATIIHSRNGKNIHLKDVAEVSFGYEDVSYLARFKNQRAIFITVQQQEGSNIFELKKSIDQKFLQFQENLPIEMQLHVVFDQSKSVAKRLNNFLGNLWQGLILVGLVMFLAVDIRAALIVMLAVPTSILIGLAFVNINHYGLQQMTIAGLIIALGMLVDNAIVVTENIFRFMRLGFSRIEAAIQGTTQIGWAVTSSTLTTVLAFIPMFVLRDVTGDYIRSMPLTVTFTLLASLFFALTFVPYLSSKFLKITPTSRLSRGRSLLNRLIERRYRPALDFALRHPGLVLGVAVLIFFLSLATFPLIGVSFFPKAEKLQLLVNIDLPPGTSLEKTDLVSRSLEHLLSSRTEVKYLASNVGRGNPRLYYNMIPEREKSNYAQILVELNALSPGRVAQFVDELRMIFKSYPGAKITVKEFEQGPPVEAPIAIRIMGDNLDILRSVAHDVEQIVAETPGTVNVENPLAFSKTDLRILINRDKAAMYGLSLADIDRTIRAAVAGVAVSQFRDQDGKEYDIMIRLPLQGKSPQFAVFDRIYLSSVTGAQIPLRQIAQIEFSDSPLKINHYHLERNVTITADVVGKTSVDRVTQMLIRRLEEYPIPKGYRYIMGGELEKREESFGGMIQAIPIALLGIFAVLVLQFKSYTQPLIIFSAIPLAVIGALLALLVTGNPFSFTAFVGLTSLVGIVVNNSIVLVDYTNQLRRDGRELASAIKEAGETRFVPILLTTATTIGGLLPLTLKGGTMYAPMGWTLIGGLATSTLLTLFVVPVLYRRISK